MCSLQYLRWSERFCQRKAPQGCRCSGSPRVTVNQPSMRRILLLLTTIVLLIGPAAGAESSRVPATDPTSISPADWPWWRGPTRNGIAPGNQRPPVTWSGTRNVVWKFAVPGRGHGSPTIVGTRVFLATAERTTQTQSLLCLDRTTGRQLWRTIVHQGNLETRGNRKSTQASCTPACDGARVYVNFLNDGSVYTTALDLQGQQVWQTWITKYRTHQGFSSSPAIYDNLVLVSADTRAGGAVAALDRRTGKVVWKHSRPKKANYTSPIVLKAAGRDQAVMVGTNLVTSFNPQSGRKIWEIDGATTECVTSVVTDGKRVFTSGGYPRNHVSAIKADGSGIVVWANTQPVYVPSMLVHAGTLYAVLDAGVATAWDSATGKTLWKKRLGGTFSSSLVLANGNIYASAEDGRTHVFKADPKSFQPVAVNKLGDEVLASLAICRSQAFQRVAVHSGEQRQEWLYCLGRKD